MATQNRNGSIELIRFLLAVVLIFFHGTVLLTSKDGALFTKGASAVEVFFIISGYYMAKAAVEKGSGSFEYMKGRYCKVFPYHTFAFIFAFPVQCAINGFFRLEFADCLKNMAAMGMLAIPEFFLFAPLTGLAFPAAVNGIEWYLSAMLLGMAILYPLVRKWPKAMYSYVAPLIFLFLSGFMYIMIGSYRGTYGVRGMFCTGLIRGLAMMALGITVYGASLLLNSKVDLDRTRNRWIISVLALIMWIIVFVHFNTHLSDKYDFGMVYIAAAAVLLTTTGKTVLAGPLSNKFVIFLGKLSLPMFLNQNWIMKALYYSKFCIKAEMGYWEIILLFMGLTLIFSLLCILIVDSITKARRKRKLKTIG